MPNKVAIQIDIPDRHNPIFGKWLQAWRKGHKLTQVKLAGIAGLSWLTIARWEEGVRRPHSLAYPRIVAAIEKVERQVITRQRKAAWQAERRDKELVG